MTTIRNRAEAIRNDLHDYTDNIYERFGRFSQRVRNSASRFSQRVRNTASRFRQGIRNTASAIRRRSQHNSARNNTIKKKNENPTQLEYKTKTPVKKLRPKPRGYIPKSSNPIIKSI